MLFQNLNVYRGYLSILEYPRENAITFQVTLSDGTRYLSKDPSRFPIRTNRSTSDVLRGTSRVSADVKRQRQTGDGQVGSGSRTSRRNIQ